jgi:hypothetical protein
LLQATEEQRVFQQPASGEQYQRQKNLSKGNIFFVFMVPVHALIAAAGVFIEQVGVVVEE